MKFFEFFFQVLESSSEEEEDEDPALEAMRAQLAKDTSMVRKEMVFCYQNCWRFLGSDKLEQLEFKLEKINRI